MTTTDVTGQSQQYNNAPTVPTVPTSPQVTPPAEAVSNTGEPMSPKLVELARKQKAARQWQMKLQAEKQEIERRSQALSQREKDYETNYIPKDRIRTDLIGVLSEAGLNAQEIANLIQNPANSLDLEMKALKRELAELRAHNEKFTKTNEETQSAQYEQAVNQIRYDVKNMVNADPRFETIKALGQDEAVVELIKETFQNGMGEKYPKGTVLNNEDAATLVEEQLVEDAMKMSSLNKVKQKQESMNNVPQNVNAAVNPAKLTYAQLSRPTNIIRTLTNQVTATPGRSPSAAEKRARAIARIEGREP